MHHFTKGHLPRLSTKGSPSEDLRHNLTSHPMPEEGSDDVDPCLFGIIRHNDRKCDVANGAEHCEQTDTETLQDHSHLLKKVVAI